MKNFKELDVYKRASALFPKIYRMVKSWKQSDQRDIGGQIIRAANSIQANVAEGFSKSPKDFKRHITIALGSCDELVSHLNDAYNIGLIEDFMVKEFFMDYEVVGKQLTKLKQNWK